MGNAWLISECYIKYPDLTEPFLRCKSLDAWIQNKAIQKIKDSLRVSNNEKKNRILQDNYILTNLKEEKMIGIICAEKQE